MDDADSTRIRGILEQVRQGDRSALGTLFQLHQYRLHRMVQARLDRRLRGRIEPSDVLQEAFIEVSDRLEKFLENENMPIFLWLRLIVAEKLITLHRKHLNTKMRDAKREVPLYGRPCPEASSIALAAHLTGGFDTPSQIVVKAERAQIVQNAVDSLSEIDREILSLRHIEQLTRTETAQVLGIEESSASKRYVRAMTRLKKALGRLPGGLKEF